MPSRYVRRGEHCLTRKQYDTLCLLREAKVAGQPLVKLEIRTAYDERSLKIMQEKDWIVESRKAFPGERRFTITGRALTVLKALEARPARKNVASDVCVTCETNPRYVSPSGRATSYCADCRNAHNRRFYATRGYSYSADVPCSRCKAAPRVTRSDGEVISPYCTDCRLKTNTARKQRFQAKMLVKQAQGKLPKCRRCGKFPVHVTPSQAYSICRLCSNADRRLYLRRSIVRRAQQRLKAKR